jgi:hypothetical protein
MHDYTLLANNNFNLNFEILQKPKKMVKMKNLTGVELYLTLTQT